MRFVGILACAFGLVAGVVPHAAFAQSSAAALEELDAQLPGDLVNDPSRLDWESYGADLERSPVVDPAIPGGGVAIRFRIKRADEFIYAAGTNIPLIKNVGPGDDVTIGFYARTIEAATDDGNGVLRVRFQRNAEPFPGFGETTLSIGKEWDWYEVTARAEQKLRTKDGIVALQFGRTQQVIEIGQAIIVKDANAIAGEAKIASITPQVDPIIPESLLGVGRLVNDPTTRYWQVAGDGGTWEDREEPRIWLRRMTRFSSAAANSSPDKLYATIPVRDAIAEGDELLIAIAARAESAATEDGRAVVGIMVQDKYKRFDSFARNRFTLGEKWQLIKLSTRSPRAYEAGTAEIMLLFSWAEQQVDIGPLYVLKTN
ncbi:MAG TPA: hypothetical protein DCS24_03635 [Erythrobacter sp.]|nr:hypothetical protein [Erythrobacter sp.]